MNKLSKNERGELVRQEESKATLVSGLSGKLIVGCSEIALDENHQYIGHCKNAPNSRYVYTSGQHASVVLNKKIVGTRGRSKLYIKTTEGRGLIIFHTEIKYLVVNTFRIWKKLEKLNLFPGSNLVKVNLSLSVKDHSFQKRPGRHLGDYEGEYLAIEVQDVNYPDFLYDLQNKKHKEVLLGEKIFSVSADDISNSRHRYKIIDDILERQDYLYGDSFRKENPNFNAGKYIKFCDSIIALQESDPFLLSGRPGKMKWGNILYCQRSKKWYWIDC